MRKNNHLGKIKLLPLVTSILVITSTVLLLVSCILPFIGGRSDKDFDERFIQRIQFRSVYDDSLEHIDGCFMGTRLEIRNLRRYIYDRVDEEYGKPERLRFNQITTGEYKIVGPTTSLIWEFGKFKKTFSKERGIKKRMYYLKIRIRQNNQDEDEDDDF